jgi:hypothetical protein
MKYLIFVLCLFTFSLSAISQVLLSGKDETIDSIIQNNFPNNLSEKEIDDLKKLIRKNNRDIIDWYDITPETEISLDNLDIEAKEVIFVEDNPRLYDDQALYQVNFTWALNNLTYLEDFSSVEVQSDSYSFKNWGMDTTYAYGKSAIFTRFNLGTYHRNLSFNNEEMYYVKFLKENFFSYTDFYWGYEKMIQSYTSINTDLDKVKKDREYHFLTFGFNFNYYFLKRKFQYHFDCALLAYGTGDDLSNEFGMKVKFGHSFKMTKHFFATPYLDIFYLHADRGSQFLTLGFDVHYRVDIL